MIPPLLLLEHVAWRHGAAGSVGVATFVLGRSGVELSAPGAKLPSISPGGEREREREWPVWARESQGLHHRCQVPPPTHPLSHIAELGIGQGEEVGVGESVCVCVYLGWELCLPRPGQC